MNADWQPCRTCEDHWAEAQRLLAQVGPRPIDAHMPLLLAAVAHAIMSYPVDAG